MNPEFKKELEQLLNKYSVDSAISMPDFILADFICEQLMAFKRANDANIAWHGWNKL